MKRYQGLLAVCVSGLLTSPVFADVEQDEIETTVVSESYLPTTTEGSTASIAVLDASVLERVSKAQLSDAVRTIPGVMIEEQGGAGGLVAISIRGGEGNFTKVLLNGVALNDPTNVRGGSYDLNLLNGIELDRIEVVKGPQSVIHGSDALAGVVHLVTPRPGAAGGPTLRLEMGEKGFGFARLSTGVDMGSAGISIDLGKHESGEWLRGSERSTNSANLQFAWDVSERDLLEGQLHYLDGDRSSFPEQSGGPVYAQSPALDMSDYRSELLALSWQRQWSDAWQSEVKVNRLDFNEQTDSPGILPFNSVPPNGSDATFTQTTASMIHRVSLVEDHMLAFGLDYRDEEGDSQGYLDFGFKIPTDYRLSRDTLGAFIQLRSALSERIDLDLSTRFDDTSSGENQHTSRVGFKFKSSETTALRANWGQAFKLPSFFALGHALVGNPTLKPEEATGFDLAVDWRISPALNVTVARFDNRYRNLIDFDPQAFTNVNRDRVETNGYELSTQWSPSNSIAVDFGLTKTDIEVVGTDRELEGRPDWQAHAGFQWQIRADLWTRMDYRLVGEVINTSLYTGQPLTLALDNQKQLDWRLAWKANSKLGFNFSIDNVFGSDYETAIGFPSVGRLVRVGLTLGL
jgi:vitamin B12 transporter